jgi:hypothetical protein
MKTLIWRTIPLALFLGPITSAPQAEAQTSRRLSSPGETAAAQLAQIGTVQTRALAAAIRRQDWNARRVEGAPRLASRQAVVPLTLALRDRSPVVRRLGAWGLSELRAAEAQHKVAPLLGDQAPEVRGEAARALGDMDAKDYAGRIAALLRDGSASVRVQAAHALGDLQHPATRPALEAALRDPDAAVRAKAGWALRRVAEAEKTLRRFGRRG